MHGIVPPMESSMQIQQHHGLLENAAFTQPTSGETLRCQMLVVGASPSAYAAVLSALQKGAKVCWVQSSAIVAEPWVMQASLGADDHALLRRPGYWKGVSGEKFAISRRHRRLRDRDRQLIQTLSSGSDAPQKLAVVALATALNNELLPFINQGNLMLIARAVPVAVLTADSHRICRVVQVVFRYINSKVRFSVHGSLTLDATSTSTLSEQVQPPMQVTGMTELQPPQLGGLTSHDKPWSSQARGAQFSDSVGIAHLEPPELPPEQPSAQNPSRRCQLRLLSVLISWQSRQPRPFTLPLAAIVAAAPEGLLLSAASVSSAEWSPLAQQQPFQWAWGEAAGTVAAIALKLGYTKPDQPLLEWLQPLNGIDLLQRQLLQDGVPLYWFDDVSHDDPDFVPIQYMALKGIVRTVRERDLHFRPETPVSRAVFATALVNLWEGDRRFPDSPSFQDVSRYHWAYASVETAVNNGWMSGITAQDFFPSRILTQQQSYEILQRIAPSAIGSLFPQPPTEELLRRRDLARMMYGLYLA